MENAWKGAKAVILFLVIVLVIQTAFGDKPAQRMSMIILFSMLILQSDKFANWISAITSNLTNGLD